MIEKTRKTLTCSAKVEYGLRNTALSAIKYSPNAKIFALQSNPEERVEMTKILANNRYTPIICRLLQENTPATSEKHSSYFAKKFHRTTSENRPNCDLGCCLSFVHQNKHMKESYYGYKSRPVNSCCHHHL